MADALKIEMGPTTGTLMQDVVINGRLVGTVLLNVGALAEGDATPYSAVYDELSGNSKCVKFSSFDRARLWIILRHAAEASC